MKVPGFLTTVPGLDFREVVYGKAVLLYVVKCSGNFYQEDISVYATKGSLCGDELTKMCPFLWNATRFGKGNGGWISVPAPF